MVFALRSPADKGDAVVFMTVSVHERSDSEQAMDWHLASRATRSAARRSSKGRAARLTGQMWERALPSQHLAAYVLREPKRRAVRRQTTRATRAGMSRTANQPRARTAVSADLGSRPPCGPARTMTAKNETTATVASDRTYASKVRRSLTRAPKRRNARHRPRATWRYNTMAPSFRVLKEERS